MNTKDNHKANIFNEDFNSDKETMCSRQKPDIPPLLAQVVPAEMRITVLGPGTDGRPVYMISKDLIYGTAEDIIEYLIDSSLLYETDPGLDIIRVGEGIEGSLYILTQFVLGGTAGGIIEHFAC